MRGNVYAACGHMIDRMLKSSFIWDGKRKQIVTMKVICEDCFLIDDQKGVILTREDVRNFLGDQVAISPNTRYSGDIYP